MACPCCNSYTCGQGCQSGTCPETEDPCLKGRRFFPGHPRFGEVEYPQACSDIYASVSDFCNSLLSTPICYRCCNGTYRSAPRGGNPSYCLSQSDTETCCDGVYTKDLGRAITSLRCSWGPIDYTATESEVSGRSITIYKDGSFLGFGAIGQFLHSDWYLRNPISGQISVQRIPKRCRRTGYSYAFWGFGSFSFRNKKYQNYDNDSPDNEVFDELDPHPWGIPSLTLLGVRDNVYCPNDNPLP
ncbi:hypothetical protein EBZ39_17880 [bacterium]|nr:hypothetical protein [bacterium]